MINRLLVNGMHGNKGFRFKESCFYLSLSVWCLLTIPLGSVGPVQLLKAETCSHGTVPIKTTSLLHYRLTLFHASCFMFHASQPILNTQLNLFHSLRLLTLHLFQQFPTLEIECRYLWYVLCDRFGPGKRSTILFIFLQRSSLFVVIH